jgi:hypothetical protein
VIAGRHEHMLAVPVSEHRMLLSPLGKKLGHDVADISRDAKYLYDYGANRSCVLSRVGVSFWHKRTFAPLAIKSAPDP